MRDIRPEGDFVVQGDFTVNEAPQTEYVPFEQMGLPDLRANLTRHDALAREERRRINGISLKLLAIGLAVFLALSVWYFIAGRIEMAMFLVALVGVGVPVAVAGQTAQQQSEFEQRQLNTVRFLSHLIREREADDAWSLDTEPHLQEAASPRMLRSGQLQLRSAATQ